MRTAVVILNWNTKDFLERFLPGLVKSMPEGAEVVVADNGSDDGSVNMLKERFPLVKMIPLDKNHGFTPAVLRQWQEEHAALTVLMDQHAWKGERLEFLGRPAMTVTSAARLAVRSGCPVVIGSFVRVGPYRYRLVGGTPLEFSRGDDVRRVTQIFNDRLGEAIRQYPEQYLWSHRRWRED